MKEMSRPITAVILAAGQGLRLRPFAADLPKGLIRFGQKCILEESLCKLLTVGIRRVVIVTGYKAELFKDLRVPETLALSFVHNSDFHRYGTFVSLCHGLDVIQNDCLVLESDLVYESRALRAVAASGDSDEARVLVTDISKSGDEVFAYLETSGHLLLSKRRDLENEAQTEFIGISYLSRKAVSHFLEIRDEAPTESNLWTYDEDGLMLIQRVCRLRSNFVPGLIWSEIDNIAQYERVRCDVYPRLQDAEHQYLEKIR